MMIVAAGIAQPPTSASPILVQHRHERNHSFYQSWANSAQPQPQGCCNNQDCGELPDADERTHQGQLQVRIEGEWCDVRPHHYLSKGNTPNWQTAHVCVTGYYGGRTPCEKLVCYQPKPGF
jgi:hypothetical protein